MSAPLEELDRILKEAIEREYESSRHKLQHQIQSALMVTAGPAPAMTHAAALVAKLDETLRHRAWGKVMGRAARALVDDVL